MFVRPRLFTLAKQKHEHFHIFLFLSKLWLDFLKFESLSLFYLNRLSSLTSADKTLVKWKTVTITMIPTSPTCPPTYRVKTATRTSSTVSPVPAVSAPATVSSAQIRLPAVSASWPLAGLRTTDRRVCWSTLRVPSSNAGARVAAVRNLAWTESFRLAPLSVSRFVKVFILV